MSDKVYDFTYTQDRELSWLAFNERVLNVANDFSVPLLERLTFISIFESNLTEFFMVRVGSIYDLFDTEPTHIDIRSHMTPRDELDAIFDRVRQLIELKDEIYNKCKKELKLRGVNHLKFKDLSQQEKTQAHLYFKEILFPLLSPVVVGGLHPFPHLENSKRYIAVDLYKKKKNYLGLIPISKRFNKLIMLDNDKNRFILTEDLIEYYSDEVFKKYETSQKAIISVNRSADVDFNEEFEESGRKNFRDTVQKMIKLRKRMRVVRLISNKELSKPIKDFLKFNLQINDDNFFVTKTPSDFSFTKELKANLDSELVRNLEYKKFVPAVAGMFNDSESIERQINRSDKLLSLPFESLDPFINLIKESARDKNTVSIKITIYRLATVSKLAKYLVEAAENGIEVFVLMELRARFDEENNINYSDVLEEAGAKIVYGFEDYKVHSKICLITKRQGSRVSYIAQVGTGNYNETTSKIYTDLSIMTRDPEITEDAKNFFLNMALGNLEGDYKALLVAPIGLRSSILQMIDEQIELVKNDQEGYIFMKMNSLTDRGIIDALAAASQVGVKVDLVIRGICCLVPGVVNKTDNIRVISIVGRFLEHSRMYIFGQGEEAKMYISSADMMTRNTKRRVEVAIPVRDQEVRRRIYKIVDTLLSDNTKATQLASDGVYYPVRNNNKKIDAQDFLRVDALRQVRSTPPSKSLWQRIMDFFKI